MTWVRNALFQQIAQKETRNLLDYVAKEFVRALDNSKTAESIILPSLEPDYPNLFPSYYEQLIVPCSIFEKVARKDGNLTVRSSAFGSKKVVLLEHSHRYLIGFPISKELQQQAPGSEEAAVSDPMLCVEYNDSVEPTTAPSWVWIISFEFAGVSELAQTYIEARELCFKILDEQVALISSKI